MLAENCAGVWSKDYFTNIKYILLRKISHVTEIPLFPFFLEHFSKPVGGRDLGTINFRENLCRTSETTMQSKSGHNISTRL